MGQRIDDVAQIVANRLNNEDGSDATLSDSFKQEFEDLKFDVAKLKNDALVENNFNDKINELENEISQMKNETSYEDQRNYNNDIQSLKQEINILKNNISAGVSSNNSNFEDEIEKLRLELDNIKNNNSSNSNIDPEVYVQTINRLQEEIDDLKDYVTAPKPGGEDNQVSGDYYYKEISLLKQDINELKNKNGDINISDNSNYQEEIDEITRKINDIYRDINDIKQIRPNVETNGSNDDLVEIKEKLETLESRMYKFISNAISTNKEKTKPQQKRPNGQIMLFGDEILSLNDIDKAKNESVDFGNLELDEEDKKAALEENKQETLFDVDNEDQEEQKEEIINLSNEDENNEEEIIQEDASLENAVEETKEEQREEENNLFAFDSKINEQAKEEVKQEYTQGLFDYKEESVNEEKEDVETEKEKSTLYENTYEDLDEEKPAQEEIIEQELIIEKPKVKDIVLDQYYDESKKESVINKVNSSLVIRDENEKNRDEIGQDTVESVLRHESDRMYPKKAVEEPQAEIIVGKQEEKVDKFAAYDIKDIEQMLFDSRLPEARNDKVRVQEVWLSLTRGIQPDLIPVAEMLQQAQVAVVGNRELLLTYPNVSLCNQVMRSRFKRDALKVLYSKLNDTYNYIALPFDVWQEKRQEYIKQYQIGIAKPRLTKLDIPGLNIIDGTQEYVTKEEKIINKAKELFGDDFVKVE